MNSDRPAGSSLHGSGPGAAGRRRSIAKPGLSLVPAQPAQPDAAALARLLRLAGRLLATPVDAGELARQVLAEGLALTGARAGAAVRIDPAGGSLEIAAELPERWTALPTGPQPPEKVPEPWCRLLEHGAPLRLDNGRLGEAGGSFAGAPALQGETRLGLLAFAIDDPDPGEAELALIGQLADLYAAGLARLEAGSQTRLLALAMEQSPVSMVVTGLDGTIRYVNPTFCRVSGYRRDEAIGQNPRVLKSGYTSSAEYQRMWAAICGGRTWRGDFHNKRRSGELYWEHASIGPLRDETGRITHFLAVKDDITRRKAAEIELLAAKEAAETANRAKSTFLAHVSHELRTPLNAIIGFAEIMDRQLFGPVGDSHYRDYARYIGDSGRHLLALINDILDLAKVEAGRMDLEEVEVEVAEEIEQACALLRPRAEAGRVLLDIEPPLAAGLPRLRADARMVRQMLLNLLSNSIKFTPAEGRVTVSAAGDSGGWLRITVADTGPGMDEDDIQVALAPFGQVRTPFHRREPGVGLGLPLTKALAELHEGALELESRPGEGTLATVRFPPQRVLAAPAGTENEAIARTEA
jgi:PAS domain S-box-containing protein